jgi:hypothetical protein
MAEFLYKLNPDDPQTGMPFAEMLDQEQREVRNAAWGPLMDQIVELSGQGVNRLLFRTNEGYIVEYHVVCESNPHLKMID